MGYKEQLKKIGECEYELPKTGKMLVPGKIFISQKLLGLVEENAIQQVANVAQLPGIVKNSLAMSDMHSGYGFCIGGVAAFDLDSGIISPGGVGYDINCLGGDSKILSELGYWKKICEMSNSQGKLVILNKESKKTENSCVSLFMKKYSEKIIKTKTKSGREISATEEHPLYTKSGMREVKDIKIGEEVLLYPFEGVEYEEPERKLLISEEDIDKLDRSFTSKLQIKNRLKRMGLLPLYSDNAKLPVLIKIMGFVFGEGNIRPSKEHTRTSFYGSKEDLETIKRDLNSIGFFVNIYSRHRKHHMKTKYDEYEFERTEHFMHCNAGSLAVLLMLLGTPVGNKAIIDYNVPDWIMNSPKWHKRLFLASLFGAEMSSPKTMTGHGFNLYGLVFSVNKRNSLHGVNFVNQISVLLEEFGIRSVLLKHDVNELNDTVSFRTRLMAYPDSNNLIKFFSQINYDYNIRKRKLANAAIIWLRLKEKVINFREQVMEKAREMKSQGYRKSKIIDSLSSQYSNKYFINKSIYQEGYGRTGSRIAFCFPSFNEFVERNCYGDGFVWDEIESKEEIEHNDLVYDFTMDSEEHNFIADGVVVSNCGIRVIATNLTKKDILKNKKDILHQISRDVPKGTGKGSVVNLDKKEIKEILETGARWAVKNGYGTEEDLEKTEDYGCIKGAKAEDVSERAISRGLPQLGSLGSGNHFLEIQEVDEIYDKEIAEKFGIKEKGQITIAIHCGSRGLGHQVASDYIKLMEDEYGWENLPDRELINAPIKSELGKKYFSAMACAANFAFCNRQMIMEWTEKAVKRFFPKAKFELIYDVCHNIAKIEEHVVDASEFDNSDSAQKSKSNKISDRKKMKLCVHRKGATRSFGPGRAELPEIYRETGQPVLLPGSMGTASYILVGTREAEEISFGSTAHGAGRVSSRSAALRNIKGEDLKKELADKGIDVEAGSWKGLVEEAPEVYKDIDEVARVSDSVGIGKLVVRLVPLAVMKG